MLGRAVTPTAHAGPSHALALGSQTGVPVGDMTVLPVVSYPSSVERFHPRSSVGRRN